MPGLRTSLLVFGCWVGLCAVAVSARASTVYDLTLTGDGGGNWHQSLDADPATTGPVYPYNFNNNGSSWKFTLSGTADVDPSISSALGITNTLSGPQTFTLTATVLGVSPTVTPGMLMSGSFLVGVSDANNDGSASLTSSPGVALYTALIGGTAVQTLDNAPVNLTVATTSGGNNLPPAGFSNVPAPVGGTSLEIKYTFTLSAGDQAAFSGVFNVDPGVGTPEPTGLGVLGLITAGLLGRRRRRAA